MTLLQIRRSLSTGAVLGGLAALLAIIVGLTIHQAHTQAAMVAMIRHTRDVMERESDLKIAVLSAETGQRGFLLAGKPDYLRPYREATRRLHPLEATLSSLLADSPAQRALLERLLPIIDRKMAEMNATLDAHVRAGSAASLRIVGTDLGRHLTEQMLALLDQMQVEEDRILAAGNARIARNLALSASLTNGGAALASLFIVLGGLLLRRASRRTRDGEERYRLLAHNVSDMVVRVDLDLRQTYVSPSSASVCGYAPDELIGRRWIELVDADDFGAIERQLERLANGRTETELLTFRMRHRDGHLLWVETALSLVRDDSGRPVSIISSIRDISSRKVQSDELRVVNLELERLARHLAKARDRAERASSAKTRFLAGMSHELRTPLNGIIGYAHLLRLEGGLAEPQEERVSSMLAAGEHLLGMINHVLDLTEIEAEHVDLQTTRIDAAATARDCMALVRPAASAKELELRLVIDEAAPLAIVADAARLRQILLNLLGNAVKFTRAGSVEMRLLAGEGTLRIEVADTGPGIAADQSHRLFGEFDRLDAAHDIEGAGLGLAISGRLVSLMGGTIGHADHRPGGSVFWIELPIGELGDAADELAVEPAGFSKRRLRILIADDVAMNRDIAQAFLRAAGHDTIVVDGGAAAIDAARAGGFDAILMDVRMPDIDGLEAARRIRALPFPGGSVPIVALTAQAFSEQVEECRAAGMNGHLSKPFAPDALLLAIERAVAMDPASLADATRLDAEFASLPVFDQIAFGQTACFLDTGAIEPYLQTIAERGETLLLGLGSRTADIASASAAHEFAGSAGMFGFSRASEIARRFERAIQTASPDAARIGRQLAAALADTMPAIRDEISRSAVQPCASETVEGRGSAHDWSSA